MATRLDALCQPGRRGDAWLKHKHRHRQRLTITAWRPGDRREPGELLLSRGDEHGQLRYAGAVRFGLNRHERARLRAVLEQLARPGSKRSRIRRVDPVLVADVDSHGRPDGPLRDPVLRAVTVAATPGSAVL